MQFENTKYNISAEALDNLNARRRSKMLRQDVMAGKCAFYTVDCTACPKKYKNGISCAGGQLQRNIANAERNIKNVVDIKSRVNERIDISREHHPLLFSMYSAFSNIAGRWRRSAWDSFYSSGGHNGEKIIT